MKVVQQLLLLLYMALYLVIRYYTPGACMCGYRCATTTAHWTPLPYPTTTATAVAAAAAAST